MARDWIVLADNHETYCFAPNRNLWSHLTMLSGDINLNQDQLADFVLRLPAVVVDKHSQMCVRLKVGDDVLGLAQVASGDGPVSAPVLLMGTARGSGGQLRVSAEVRGGGFVRGAVVDGKPVGPMLSYRIN